MRQYDDIIAENHNGRGIPVVIDFTGEFYLTDEIFIELSSQINNTSKQYKFFIAKIPLFYVQRVTLPSTKSVHKSYFTLN